MSLLKNQIGSKNKKVDNKITKHPEIVKKEKQLTEKQKELRKRKSTLKSLKTRLSNTREEIEDIGRKIQGTMQRLMAETIDLMQKIKALAEQLLSSENISNEDKQGLKMIVDDLNEAEMLDEDAKEFREQYQKRQDGDFDFDENAKAKMRDLFEEFKVEPPQAEQRNIRSLFLKLSKEFHPDLADTDYKREKYHSLQQEINAAYKNNDIHRLLEIEEMNSQSGIDLSGKSFDKDDLDNLISSVERQITQINAQIDRTSQEIKNLRQSQYGEMLTQVKKAGREGMDLDDMTMEQEDNLENLRKLEAALVDSVKIDGISPLFQQVMEEMRPPSEDDFLEMLGMSDGGFGFFDDEEEKVENPKFPIGSSVKVLKKKRGKNNPQGRVGRVIDCYYAETDTSDDYFVAYTVQYDSVTLNELDDKAFAKLHSEIFLHEGEDFTESELESTEPRDTPQDAIYARDVRIFKLNFIFKSEEQKSRVEKVCFKDKNLSMLENWMNHLQQELSVPVKGRTLHHYFFVVDAGLKTTVQEISHISEEDQRIIARTKITGYPHLTYMPIDNFEYTGKDTKTYRLLYDFSTWHENFEEEYG